jgi:hypothetical protein
MMVIIIFIIIIIIINIIPHNPVSRDSLDDIETGYGLDGRNLTSGRGKRFFSSPQHSARLWGHPAFYSMDAGSSFPGDKLAKA